MSDVTISKHDVTAQLYDFSQSAFETFQMATIKASRDAYFAFNDSTGVTAVAKVRGETVRSAIQTGILKGVDIKDVDTLKPYVVAWLADEIQKHVKKISSAPEDPN